MTWRLRYIPGTNAGTQFATITYPMPHEPGYPTRERAALVLQSMPDPTRMEIFEESDD